MSMFSMSLLMGCVFKGSFIFESPPPAHPTVTTPKSSLSMLSIIFPVSISDSNANAPVSPVSSSTVNKPSICPCFNVLSSSIARVVATPIPSSAPSVVPSAVRMSPLSLNLIGSLVKSWSTSLFFSQTISI